MLTFISLKGSPQGPWEEIIQWFIMYCISFPEIYLLGHLNYIIYNYEQLHGKQQQQQGKYISSTINMIIKAIFYITKFRSNQKGEDFSQFNVLINGNLRNNIDPTVCPRSLEPFNTVTYYIILVRTSLTCCTIARRQTTHLRL